MLQFSRTKIIFVILICVFGIYTALPNFLKQTRDNQTEEESFSFLPKDRVNLGLDLQGGSYLLLEVDTDSYLKEQLDDIKEGLRTGFRKNRVGYKGLDVVGKKVLFSLRDVTEKEAIEKIIKSTSNEVRYNFDAETNLFSVFFTENALKNINDNVLRKSIEIVRKRVDETGTREPIIQKQGKDRILLQVPGLKDVDDLKSLLGKTAKMTFHLMHPSDPFPSSLRRASFGHTILRSNIEENTNRYYMVNNKVMLSGDLLINARSTFSEGQPVVEFTFNNKGGRIFSKITKENVQKPFAIVLDGAVISAPIIQSHIPSGKGIISGNFTVKTAEELAILLRSGALPAPINILEERTVGPSLGQDSIEAGKIAGIIAVIAILVMMILFYGLFGLFSNIALILNIILLLASLTVLNATLTLPGIAGIILTMGIAVDSNVLIFERIKEEISKGKTPLASIDNGFKQAFKTIIDANITTLIATFLLFSYGSGPVKGFAVTLSIGILTSMFSAILITRMMIIIWLKNRKPKQIPL